MSAQHEAVLADGRRVVLLDDRGWSAMLSVSEEAPEHDGRRDELPSIWAFETVERMQWTARDVVGPDDPFERHTQADMEASHWEALAQILRNQGVDTEGADLKVLPHDVELSTRVLARIGRRGPNAPSDEQ